MIAVTAAEQRAPELWLPCPHCGRRGIYAQSSLVPLPTLCNELPAVSRWRFFY
jgi:hypothetical protein